MKHPLPILLLAALAGCAAAVDPPAAETPAQHSAECHAEPAQFAVGQAISDALGEDARQKSGASIVRVIPPDGAVTMDFRTDRLNLRLDAAGTVVEARCG